MVADTNRSCARLAGSVLLQIALLLAVSAEASAEVFSPIHSPIPAGTLQSLLEPLETPLKPAPGGVVTGSVAGVLLLEHYALAPRVVPGDSHLAVRIGHAAVLDDADISDGGKRHVLKDHLVMYGVMWAFTLTVNHRNLGRKLYSDVSFKRLGRNFVSRPVMADGDRFTTNYLAHPFAGAYTYNSFRNRGYSAKESFFASALHSALFEYTIEGFVQPPSGTDLLVTPLLGAPLGALLGKWLVPAASPFVVLKYVFGVPI